MAVKPSFLVVARNGVVNKFEQASILEALNVKDYLHELGGYQEISIFFQLSLTCGSDKNWVKLDALES